MHEFDLRIPAFRIFEKPLMNAIVYAQAGLPIDDPQALYEAELPTPQPLCARRHSQWNERLPPIVESKDDGGFQSQAGETTMTLTPVGIDIAKNVMQLHYVDQETGES
ncbi:hypothetical protein QFZ39_005280 [Paraburkholderia graminis]|nr:hypothetical protein [Paraburkholderia graminis]